MRPLDDPRDPALPDHAEPADAGSPRPAPAEPPAATPVMAQYWALKEAHPGCLLFFRMGDFYELFFEDAVAAAAALDIALTKRGRHLGEDIPMCGVPAASHEGYLARLIRRGFKVAVCEQLEAPADARKRGAKAVVARDVVRIVTPGTLTEETLLEARRPNHLAALAAAGDRFGLAWVDISTGRPGTQVLRAAALPAALARIEPGELLVPDHLADRRPLKSALADWQARLTLLPAARFERRSGERRLGQLYGVATLAAFGDFDRVEIAALGALIDYVLLTQKGKLPRLAPPVRLTDARILQIDAASRRNLELMAGADGGRAGSLLATIDRTVTGMGARCLAGRLAAPLTDPAAIERRLAAVAWFFDDPPLRRRLRVLLKECPDIERALSRLAVGRGGPRDLAQIRDGLACSEALAAALATADGVAAMPPALAESGPRLADPAGDGGGLRATLAAALAEALPAAVRDGGLIAAGHDAALDALRLLRDDSRRLILELEARYVAETGLGQLRIRHNALLGYYVEVPQRLAERVPAAPAGPFIQRQSMANAVRYQTVDLADLERRIARAADEMIAREAALFQEMADRVLAAAPAIAAAARAIARVDVAAALAELAETARYVRPSVDRGGEIVICGGRHPVVEARLGDEAAAGRFVANDCRLGEEHRLWLLTGPNMAGKSTFLRQTALIILLAQVGSFVPADTARIGVVDRLFSRVGAADDLARGRSTFMVEMVETATILAEAGPASFVILDEVGRGTATFDGLAIAWAVVEHLAEHSRCRGLIATHYHELTALAARLPALGCYTMRTKEWRGDVVFLHEVTAGAADRSYGVHVARLAGLPRQVIGRAEAILRMLERSEPTSALTRLAADLPLFAAALARPAEAAVPPPAAPPAPSPVEARLREIDPDTLTPRQALDLLYDLKAELDGAP